MEIYKIGEEIGGEDKRPKRNESKRLKNEGFLKITNLKQGVKNPNRVNVFLDGKYEFSLDVSQVVDFKIKIGQELTALEVAELKKASEFGKLYQRTLEWVLMRPRSKKEVRDYIVRKLRASFSERPLYYRQENPKRVCPSLWSSEELKSLSSEVIERLAQRGYLDDRKFAEYYLENRFAKKGISRRRLEMELLKKGVLREIIEEALGRSERNDEEEILKIIAKKRTKYTDEQLIGYLCRQGFSYQLVQNLVRSFETD